MSDNPRSLRPEQEKLHRLIGRWEGENSTWLDPSAPPDRAPCACEFAATLDGMFVRQTYESRVSDRAHSGVAYFGHDEQKQKYTCVWFDTFHNGSAFLVSEGEERDGKIVVLGGYPAGDQFWGWRTELDLISDDELVITAYNISPDGQEAPAVESRLTRLG